jgi:hypothetical protein
MCIHSSDEVCHRTPSRTRAGTADPGLARFVNPGTVRRYPVGIITLIGAIVVIVVVLKFLGLW